MNKTLGSVPYSLALRPSIPGDKNSEKKIYGTIQQRETIGLRQLDGTIDFLLAVLVARNRGAQCQTVGHTSNCLVHGCLEI